MRKSLAVIIATICLAGGAIVVSPPANAAITAQVSPTKPSAGIWLDVPSIKEPKTVCVFGILAQNFPAGTALSAFLDNRDKRQSDVFVAYVGTTDTSGSLRSSFELNDSESQATGDGTFDVTVSGGSASANFTVKVSCVS